MKRILKSVLVLVLAAVFAVPFGIFVSADGVTLTLKGSAAAAGISLGTGDNSEYIYLDSASITVLDFLNAVATTGVETHVYSSGEPASDITNSLDSTLTTNYTVKITNSSNPDDNATYTFLLKGDVNRDGAVNSGDYAAVVGHISGTAPLSSLEQTLIADGGSFALSLSGDNEVVATEQTTTLTLNVSASSLPTNGLSYLKFSLTYYPTVFAYENSAPADAIDGWTIAADDSNGTVNYSIYKEDFQGMSGSSPLFTITFTLSDKTLSNQSMLFTVSAIKGVTDNGEVVTASNVNKSVTVNPTTPEPTPESPALSAKTETTITLDTQSGYYYACTTSSIAPTDSSAWTQATGASLEFSGLSAGTSYYIHYKSSETGTAHTLPVAVTTDSVPTMPTLSGKTETSITIDTQSGYYYACTTSSETPASGWVQATGSTYTFTGLASSTSYHIHYKIKEGGTPHKLASAVVTETAIVAPTVSETTVSSITISTQSGYYYACTTSSTAPTDSSAWTHVSNTTHTFADLTAETSYYIHYKAAENGSPLTLASAVTTSAAPAGPSVESKTTSKIKLANTQIGYYYACATSSTAPSATSSAWKVATETTLEFTGLTVGTTYYVFYKPSENGAVSLMSGTVSTDPRPTGPSIVTSSTTSSKIVINFGDFERIWLGVNKSTSGTGDINVTNNVTKLPYTFSAGNSCYYSIDTSAKTLTLTDLTTHGAYYIRGVLADGTRSEWTVWFPDPTISDSAVVLSGTAITIPHLSAYRYSLNGSNFVTVDFGRTYFSGSSGPYIVLNSNDLSFAEIGGLSENTDYTLKIQAYDDAFAASNEGTYTFKTTSGSSGKPSAPATREITESSVSFSYTDYNIIYKVGNSVWTSTYTSSFPVSSSPATLSSGITYYFNSATSPNTITFAGLQSSRTYDFSLRYASAENISENILTLSKTTSSATVVGKPSMPSLYNSTDKTLTFEYDSGVVYRVDSSLWTTSGKYPTASNYGYLSGSVFYYFDSSVNPRYITFSGLKASTAYTVSVKYEGAGDISGNIASGTFTTKSSSSVPSGKPTFPTASEITGNSITFPYNSAIVFRVNGGIWTAEKNPDTGRSPIKGSELIASGTGIAYYYDSATNPKYITFSNLKANTEYTFDVKYDGASDSTSTIASENIKTNGNVVTPTMPKLESAGDFFMTFAYDRTLRYKINDSAWTPATFTSYPTYGNAASLGGNVKYYFDSATDPKKITISGLSASTTYTLSVRFSTADDTPDNITSARYSTTVHVHEYTDYVKAATCTEDGISCKRCAGCGNIDESTLVTTPKIGHDWVETLRTEPTCAEEGIITYTCRNCGEKMTEHIPTTEHEFAHYDVASTCTVKGYTCQKCKVCGYENPATKVEKELVPHEFEKVSERCVAPTCTEEGHDVLRCKICGHEETRTVAATGHEYVLKTTASSCTEHGRTYLQCVHDSYIDPDSVTELPLVAHEYEWVRITNAKTGIITERRVCKICGGISEEITIRENSGGSASYEYLVGGESASVSEVVKKAQKDGCETLAITFTNGVTVVIENKNLSLFTSDDSWIDVSEITAATAALSAAGYDFNDEKTKFAAYEITASESSVKKGDLATVKIEFALEDGMKQTVYFVSGDGSKEKIRSTYKDGVVTFSANHFSTYVIEQSKSGVSGVAIAIIVVVAVILATAGTFGYMVIVAKKRKAKRRVRF